MHGLRSSWVSFAASLLVAAGCGGGGGGGGGGTTDTTGPTLAITNPSSSTVYVASASVAVTATFSDPAGVTLLEWSRDGITFTSVAFSGTAASTTVDLGTLSDGAAVVVIFRAVDGKGNATEVTRTFIPDLGAPSITFTSMSADANCSGATCTGAVLNGTVAAPWSISGAAVDAAFVPAGMVRVSVFDPAAPTPPLVDQDVPVTAGTWEYVFTSFPADGAYRITVTGTDSQARTTTATRNFIIDRTPPTLAITAPASDADCSGAACTGAVVNGTGNWVSGSAPTVQGTLSDGGTGLSSFQRALDGGAPATMSLTATWNVSLASTFPSGEDGVPHALVLTATDKAGNPSVATRNILVDNLPPAAVVTSPANTGVSPVGGGAAAQSITVAGSLGTCGTGCASAQYRWTSGGSLTALPLDPGTGDFSVAGLALPPASDYVSVPFALALQDRAGNSSSPSFPIVVDNVPPTYAYAGTPYSILAVTGGSTAFGGAFDDGSYGVAIPAALPTVAVRVRRFSDSLYSVPLTISTTPVLANITFSAAWNAVPSGVNGSSDYYLEITVTDAAGNHLTEADEVLSIDNVSPRIKTVALDGTDGWLVSGQRFVAKTAPLVAFSEPMAAASVTAGNPATAAFGMNVSTGATDIQLVSDDGGYGWHFPAGAYPYSHTSLTMTLQTDAFQAKDLAGNPVTTATPPSQTFLVEADPFPSTPVALPGGVSSPYAHPRVSVDPDGIPYVAYTIPALGQTHLASFTGWTGQVIRSWTAGSIANPVTLGDFRLCISDVNATTLYRSTSAAFAYLYGAETSSRTQIGYRTGSFTWPTNGLTNGTGSTTNWDPNVAGNSTLTTPAGGRQPIFLQWARTANTLADCNREILHIDDAATTPTFKATAGSTTYTPAPPFNPFTAGDYVSFLKQRGAATYENCATLPAQSTCIRYRDPGIGTVPRTPGTENTERSSSFTATGVTAVTSLGQPYRGAGTTMYNQDVSPVAPAFIAAIQNSGLTTISQRVYAYCTATPGTGGWTSGNTQVYSWPSAGTARTVHDLQVAQSTGSIGKFVIAVSVSESSTDENLNPVVRVYSVDAPGTACPATLNPTLLGTLTVAKHGSVGIGPSGEVYVTYIDPTGNGGNGVVILQKL